MILDTRVRAAWVGLNTPLEGCVAHMYQDIRGLVTVGIGNLIDPVGGALSLPWTTPTGRTASRSEIRGEWERVKAMQPGLLAARYELDGGGLTLEDSAIEGLVLARLDADADILTARWPELPDWPAAAQAATAALAWAVGAGAAASGLTGPSWPHLARALGAQDWKVAALAGQLSWAGNAGVRPRDFVVQALYLDAAGVAPDEARALPPGPSAEAAMMALAAWDATAA